VAGDGASSTKPLMDRLGVKPGARVAVLGIDDPSFHDQLGERTKDVSLRRRSRLDMLFLGIQDRGKLKRLHTDRAFIDSGGAIWVVWPKGQRELMENDVRDEALDAGLVDVKVVSFSGTHSALKLVIPLANRVAPGGRR